VAIKKMKRPFRIWRECLDTSEIRVKILNFIMNMADKLLKFGQSLQALVRLKGHPNIIEVVRLEDIDMISMIATHSNFSQLLEVIREKETLYLVFEFMEENLCTFLRKHNGVLSEAKIRNIMCAFRPKFDFVNES
jgi:serine/threonine protein kinase